MQDVLAKHLVIWHNLQDHFKRTMSIMDYTAMCDENLALLIAIPF